LVERILVSLDLAEVPPVRAQLGNPKAQVRVDRHTALYYCAGSELYGKTAGGDLLRSAMPNWISLNLRATITAIEPTPKK
jgi:hypothetical protein